MRPTSSTQREPAPSHGGWRTPVLLVVLTVAVAALGGVVSGGDSDPWYRDLQKSTLTPPGWVFGVVWPVLYTIMAAAAVLVARAPAPEPLRRAALLAYVAQLTANLAWSWLFFGFHQPLLALLNIALLVGAVALTAMRFWSVSRLAALLLAPYGVWLCFAAWLNGFIVVANS